MGCHGHVGFTRLLQVHGVSRVFPVSVSLRLLRVRSGAVLIWPWFAHALPRHPRCTPVNPPPQWCSTLTTGSATVGRSGTSRAQSAARPHPSPTAPTPGACDAAMSRCWCRQHRNAPSVRRRNHGNAQPHRKPTHPHTHTHTTTTTTTTTTTDNYHHACACALYLGDAEIVLARGLEFTSLSFVTLRAFRWH